MRARQGSRQTAFFVVTVVSVVVAFTVAAAVVSLRSKGIGEAAEQITDYAAPGLEGLVVARSNVELVRLRTERYLQTPTPERRTELWNAVLRLRESVAEYIGMPAFAEERLLWSELLSSMNAVVVELRRVENAIEAGERVEARRLAVGPLERALQRAEGLLARAQQVNADAVRELSRSIEDARAAALRETLVLNGLCVALAAVLLIWAVRGLRRQRALEASYAQVLRERADELELFAGRVAHDILSPLASSGLALEVLARDADGRVSGTARRGLGGVAKVRSTVEGLLEFARAAARPPEGVMTDLVEVTQDVVSSFEEQARTAAISLSLTAPRDARDVGASCGVLTSILTNLLQNAIRYMGASAERRISVRVLDRGGRVRVEVQDTGPGIAEEQQQRIFEPYVRAAERGTPLGIGLGLATVRRLVEAHGGSVDLESTSGRGATFAFELPIVEKSPPPRSRRAA